MAEGIYDREVLVRQWTWGAAPTPDPPIDVATLHAGLAALGYEVDALDSGVRQVLRVTEVDAALDVRVLYRLELVDNRGAQRSGVYLVRHGVRRADGRYANLPEADLAARDLRLREHVVRAAGGGP